jgi:gamma-glutamyltranspeptidase/glutathione hydrolase
VVGYGGMVATQDAHATKAAAEVLAEGGNAIDAAVTAGFALAVTLPRAGNIGGGGFMVVNLADTHQQMSIDYREKAPKAATRDMFLDAKGNPVADLSQITHLAAGVPGTVRGLTLALEKYGTISLQRALAPAIKLAEEGFPVGEDLFDSLKFYSDDFEAAPEAMKIFFQPDHSPWPIGSILVQKDLAKSLRLISEQGPDAFYKGAIAEAIVADMAANGGLITAADLEAYKPILRKPVTGTYRGLKVVSMPPPSSGGVHLIQMLNILERFPIEQFGHNSADAIHVSAEAMRLAYADRSRYLGDPDFTDIPTAQLISKKYARGLAERIDPKHATPSLEVAPGLDPLERFESNETTHFSVIDRHGNAVSNTYTLNFSYGSKLVVPGTGILLNNEMDDFSAKAGVPNAYGLIGGRRNAIEPEKRMLSSMTPTLIFKEDGSIIATGSPGGSRIINIVLEMVCNLADHDMNVAEATAAPRFHHQWFPDEIRVERGFSPDTIRLLAGRGHKVRLGPALGSTQTVSFSAGVFQGASDPRRRGALTIGLPPFPEEEPARPAAKTPDDEDAKRPKSAKDLLEE